MFLLGLIVALVLLAGGLAAGSFIQFKTSWPWVAPPAQPKA